MCALVILLAVQGKLYKIEKIFLDSTACKELKQCRTRPSYKCTPQYHDEERSFKIKSKLWFFNYKGLEQPLDSGDYVGIGVGAAAAAAILIMFLSYCGESGKFITPALYTFEFKSLFFCSGRSGYKPV